MGTIDDLVRDLRGFDANAEVTKALRRELVKAAVPARVAIRKNAVAILPHTGGLGAWTAASKITSKVTVSGHVVTLTLVGRRGKSDLKAINRGRVRHPSWGRRGRGQWHTQAVAAGFFTDAAADAAWRAAAARAVDQALEALRG